MITMDFKRIAIEIDLRFTYFESHNFRIHFAKLIQQEKGHINQITLTTLIIPISACYYLELHSSAIMSYSGVQLLLMKAQ